MSLKGQALGVSLVWMASTACMMRRTLGGIMVWGTWGLWLAVLGAILTAGILVQHVIRGERLRAADIAAIAIDRARLTVIDEEGEPQSLRIVEDPGA